jgi:hypothetical protein
MSKLVSWRHWFVELVVLFRWHCFAAEAERIERIFSPETERRGHPRWEFTLLEMDFRPLVGNLSLVNVLQTAVTDGFE